MVTKTELCEGNITLLKLSYAIFDSAMRKLKLGDMEAELDDLLEIRTI